MEPEKKFEIKPGVRVERWHVVNRLKELGLTYGQVVDSVRLGCLAASNCTANHPPLMRGIVGWGEIVAALRDATAADGWTRSDAKNYSLTIDPTGQIAIAVATGDESTGIPNATPSTRSTKGPQTVQVVNFNSNQLLLFSDPPLPSPIPPASPDGRATYILLVHAAPNEVRFELSLPDHMTDGRIDDWLERIIFSPIPLDGEQIEIETPPQPDLDITVIRKK